MIMRKIVRILHGCKTKYFLISPLLFIKTVAIKFRDKRNALLFDCLIQLEKIGKFSQMQTLLVGNR